MLDLFQPIDVPVAHGDDPVEAVGLEGESGNLAVADRVEDDVERPGKDAGVARVALDGVCLARAGGTVRELK